MTSLLPSRPMLFRFFLPFFLAIAVGFAASKDQSLGLNLDYIRVHALPADLPSSTTRRANSLVLDLRFVKADKEEAAALAAWLQFQAKPRSPVMVLVNAGTSPSLLASLAPAKASPGVISIAPADRGFKPDIALDVTPEADREAYDALENGSPLDELIARKLDKARRDEASVARDRNGNAAPGPEATTPTDDSRGPTGETKAPAPPPPPSPFDAVLQRAIQIHRGLLALKKI